MYHRLRLLWKHHTFCLLDNTSIILAATFVLSCKKSLKRFELASLSYPMLILKTLFNSGNGSRTQYPTGYEPGMIIRFTLPQLQQSGSNWFQFAYEANPLPLALLQKPIGVAGFEPTASWSQITPSAKLIYTPLWIVNIYEIVSHSKDFNILQYPFEQESSVNLAWRILRLYSRLRFFISILHSLWYQERR